jgi:ankyrin repeat protein
MAGLNFALLGAIKRKEPFNIIEGIVNTNPTLAVTYDDYDFTPLHEAARRYQDVRVLQLLINNGADVNARTVDGRSPLFVAVETFTTPCLECVQCLIDSGADVNNTDDILWTPLFLALDSDNFELTQLLLNAGANVNAKDDEGWTPLHISVYRHSSIIHLLLDYGADPTIKDNQGRRAVDMPDINDTVREAIINYVPTGAATKSAV